MEGVTRRGIYLNLEISPYTVEIAEYGLTLYFSSAMYKRHYQEKVADFVRTFNPAGKKLSLPIDWGIVPYVELYWRTEKRGFLMEWKGEKIWQEKALFVGGLRTRQNSPQK